MHTYICLLQSFCKQCYEEGLTGSVAPVGPGFSSTPQFHLTPTKQISYNANTVIVAVLLEQYHSY